MAYGALVPWSGIKPESPALEEQNPNPGPPGKSLFFVVNQDFYHYIPFFKTIIFLEYMVVGYRKREQFLLSLVAHTY